MVPATHRYDDGEHQPNRWFAGLHVAGDLHTIVAALVRASGSGLESRPELVLHETAEIPRDCAANLLQLRTESAPPALAAHASASLADVGAAMIGRMVARQTLARDRVVAVGCDDPGLWHYLDDGQRRHQSLCDAPRLAELSGQNVVDAFPARDLAAGGLGGPVAPLAKWLLLRDPRRWRVLVDLGRTTRLVFLPPGASRGGAGEVSACDAGPGMALLDLLAHRLTSGAQRFDPGGRLAVQGQQIPELLSAWLANPYFDRCGPRWHPGGVRPERFLGDAIQQAVARDWSVRDMLCTATHLVAELVARAVERSLRHGMAVDELLLAGGGTQNGFLLHELGQRLPKMPLVRVADLGWPSHALQPAAAAVLAMFFVDQVPASLSSITGTVAPRVLGRLAPGSPQAYQRFLQATASSRPGGPMYRVAG